MTSLIVSKSRRWTSFVEEVRPVRPGGFADWMRSQGKLGGQHKVPRMDNTGRLTERLGAYFLQ